MTTSYPLAALLSVPALRLGPLRLTAYGICATAGVLLAMALSGRSARRLGVHPDAAWDTGLFAVLSCFFASRLLLVLRDPVAFTRFPWLVLALPSLTVGGLALAAVLVLVYLWFKRLPRLTMMDLFAPGGAVLAAALELGHWIDGSEPGMPIGFLNRSRAWDLRSLHLYPVAALGTLASAALAALLWRALPQGRRAPAQRPGRVAAAGLLVGGLVAFGLGMLSLPDEVLKGQALDPGQMVALAATVAGALLWSLAPEAPSTEGTWPPRVPGSPSAGDSLSLQTEGR